MTNIVLGNKRGDAVATQRRLRLYREPFRLRDGVSWGHLWDFRNLAACGGA